jgi:hypothetical protein
VIFFLWLGRIPAHVWHAAFRQGNLRLWATILGAPPLCGILVWGLDLLAQLAVQPEPVRAPIVMAIADILKIIAVTILVIVLSLALMKVRATTPAGSLDIGGDQQDPSQPERTPHV